MCGAITCVCLRLCDLYHNSLPCGCISVVTVDRPERTLDVGVKDGGVGFLFEEHAQCLQSRGGTPRNVTAAVRFFLQSRAGTRGIIRPSGIFGHVREVCGLLKRLPSGLTGTTLIRSKTGRGGETRHAYHSDPPVGKEGLLLPPRAFRLRDTLKHTFSHATKTAVVAVSREEFSSRNNCRQ